MTDGGDVPGQLNDATEPPNERADAGAGESADQIRGVEEQSPQQLAEPRPETVQTPRSTLDEETLKEYTTERRSLDSTVQIQWALRTTITALILGMIASAILAAFDIDPVFGSIAVGLFLFLGVVWVVLRYRMWVYQIRDDSVYLERGVVTNVRTIVPYVRIQHVDTSRGPLERALGLSTLVVYTAGSRGADVSIPGLKPEEARDLQQRLKKLAIEAEGDDAL
jgi:membrane protein YdbS with pleckstrin-like domain